MKKTIVILTLASLAGQLLAAPQAFDFKDPKGVNSAGFKLDAPLEAISGSANGVSGTVTFDPGNPGAIKGKIVVSTATLHVPNPMMKQHLHGAQWMDVAKYPEITFETKTVTNVKTQGDTTTADVTGTFTLRGVAKEITVPVKINYLKGKLAARTNGQAQGDLLVLRTNFSVQRADYGINPSAPSDKVSETVDVSLSIAGASPSGTKTASN